MSTITIITSPPPKPPSLALLDASPQPVSHAVETFHSRDEAIAYLQSLEE